MEINADHTQRVVINHHDLPWVASHESGVERRMLERQGGEVGVARGTSCFVLRASCARNWKMAEHLPSSRE